MSQNSHFTLMVHVLTLLAGAHKPVSSSFIAGSVNTNPVLIRHIIGQLRNAGLVETIPGSTGGARLNRSASGISLSDIYQLVKKEMLFGLHAKSPNPNCPVGRNIQDVLGEVYDEMDTLLDESLSRTSIADILANIVSREGKRSG